MAKDLNGPEIASHPIIDQSTFGAIFEQYHKRIWSYLVNMAGVDLADELLGDVFVAAFESRHSYQAEKGSVKAWLYGIARNKLRMKIRSERRRKRAFEREAGRSVAVVDPAQLVAELVDLREEVLRVRLGMAKLKDDDRELIVLYVWEELSYEDIATTLGIPIGTVRSRLNRARLRLRQLADGIDIKLGPEGGTHSGVR